MQCLYVEDSSCDEVVASSRHMYELETRLLIEVRKRSAVNQQCSLYNELKKAEELQHLREMRLLRAKNSRLEKELNDVLKIQSQLDNEQQQQQPEELLATLTHIKSLIEKECKSSRLNGKVTASPFNRQQQQQDCELVQLNNKRQQVLCQLRTQIDSLTASLLSQEQQQQQQQQQQNCQDVVFCSQQSLAFLLLVRGLLDSVPHLVICPLIYGLALSLLIRSFHVVLPTTTFDILENQLD